MKGVGILLFVVLFLCGFVLADPAVSSVSGTVEHGGVITVSGADFGVKSPAAPLWWDDGECGSNCPSCQEMENAEFTWAISGVLSGSDKHYNDAWPAYYSDDTFATTCMQYRDSGFRSIGAPHSRSTKFLGGAHEDADDCIAGGERGQNAGITVSDLSTHEEWYARAYMRVDPLWPTVVDCTSVGNRHNYKFFNWETVYPYRSYQSTPFKYDNAAGCSGGYNDLRRNPMCGDSWVAPEVYQIVDYTMCGDGNEYPVSTHDTNVPSEYLGWISTERFLKTTTSDQFYKIMRNNVEMLDTDNDIEGDCDLTVTGEIIGGATFGGFWACQGNCPGHIGDVNYESFSDDAYRYFDDVYVDNTFSRVVLTNNVDYDSSTIIEPQIPSAWSSGSITTEVNLGALTGDTAYLFVFDSNNGHNPTGRAVDLTGSSAQSCSQLGGVDCCTGGETCQGTTYSGSSDCLGTCCSQVCTPTQGDAIPPSAVADLVVSSCSSSSCTLSWTASGDDGAVGTASGYDIRYSILPINESNWGSASQVSGESSPQVSGSSETFTVTGISSSTNYYFAIKTFDEVPNIAAISNVPSGITQSAGVDALLVGWDSDDYDNGCWSYPSTSIHDYTWKASRLRAASSGIVDYFKLRVNEVPTGCTNDDGCWAIYEDGGISTNVGALKAYGCFSGYDWTTIGVGTHTFPVTNTMTNLSVTAGDYYSLVIYSTAIDNAHYGNAGCSSPIYQYRGSSQANCFGTLDGMNAIAGYSNFPPPPADYDYPVASYFVWSIWSSGESAQQFCPDGVCNGTETCVTCVLDCGDCSCVHVAEIEPCDGVVSVGEIVSYIDDWKTGGVSIGDVLGAVNVWKFG